MFTNFIVTGMSIEEGSQKVGHLFTEDCQASVIQARSTNNIYNHAGDCHYRCRFREEYSSYPIRLLPEEGKTTRDNRPCDEEVRYRPNKNNVNCINVNTNVGREGGSPDSWGTHLIAVSLCSWEVAHFCLPSIFSICLCLCVLSHMISQTRFTWIGWGRQRLWLHGTHAHPISIFH